MAPQLAQQWYAIQCASLTAAPCWYPAFRAHLRAKAELVAGGMHNVPAGMYAGFMRLMPFQLIYPPVVLLTDHLNQQVDSWGGRAAIAAAVGASTALVCNPMDVMILKKLDLTSSRESLTAEIARDRWRLWRGSGLFALRNSAFSVALLCVYPAVYDAMLVSHGSTTSSIVAAAVASVVSNGIGHIPDMMSVCQQATGKKVVWTGFHTAGFAARNLATTVELVVFYRTMPFWRRVFA